MLTLETKASAAACGRRAAQVAQTKGEMHQRRQRGGERADFPFAQVEETGDEDGGGNADQGRGHMMRPSRRQNGRQDYGAAKDRGHEARVAQPAEDACQLADRRGCGASGGRSQPQDDVQLRDQHHAADAARKSRDHRMRHARNVPAEARGGEDEHEQGGQNGKLRRALDTALPGGEGKKRHRNARGPSDQDRVASQERDDRRGQDRGEDPQDGRQPHQRRHRQSVRKGDQGGNDAARGIADEPRPAVSFRARGPATREGAGDHAITLRKAVLNLFISSCDPTVMRTWVGQAGQMRPM